MIALDRMALTCCSCRRPFLWAGTGGKPPTLCPSCRKKRVQTQARRKQQQMKLHRRKLRRAVIGKGFFDMVDDNHFCLRPNAGSWAGKVPLNKKSLIRIFDKPGMLVFYPMRKKTS